jgi:two-component system NtrC family sensor kinase
MQKEKLMNELTDLNSDLDRRVQEATAELRAAYEMVLRNETLSAVGTFASGVAHELATPIASIMIYFQMVKERVPQEDKLADDVQIIEKELKRCNTILRGMLDFAKAPEKEKTLTNINAIIHDLLALVRYQPAYKRTIAIKEDLGPSIPMVPALPGQLRQVFMNVIVNALQAMPDGGTLCVSTSMSVDGRMVIVGISDTGRGIPQDELDRIFQPFYTGRETGTGLGLSISYGIIKGHGGEMEVKSKEGQGTTFFIYLPLSSDLSFMTEPSAAEDAEFKGARG